MTIVPAPASTMHLEPPPVAIVTMLFAVSTIGVLLLFVGQGILQWAAAVVALSAPVEAERVLNGWRRRLLIAAS
jgi:hypothetical protein